MFAAAGLAVLAAPSGSMDYDVDAWMAHGGPPADVAAVNALRTKFETVFNSGDSAAATSLYTADAIVAENHQPNLVGRDAIVKYYSDLFAQAAVKIQLTAEETKTFGDHAYDRGRVSITVTPKAPGAQPMTQAGRYLVLLRKEADGQWRASHDFGNSPDPMPEPAPAPEPKKDAKKGGKN